MTSIYELKMGAEKLEALKFLLSQIKDLEAAVKSIDVNELREFRYLAQKMQGLESDVAKSKELIEKAKNDLEPLAADVERVGKAAKDEIDIKAQTFNASLARKAEEFEQIKSSFESKYTELAALKTRIEDALKSVSSPIDDETAAENKTFSSKKIEDTFAKKTELPSDGVNEARVNSLISEKTASLASKEELGDKLSTTTYESEKANFATKTQLGAYVTASSLGNYLTRGQLDNALSKYTKAQNISGNSINFLGGVNFTGSASGQIAAGPREGGQSGLVYINGNGVTGFSSDFVVLNPTEATYGQGYVFFSYFVRPTDNKILISFIKAQ
nr:MAG TPA: chromosome segregation ATPase [Caudoviricetes sp.]